MKYKLKTGDNLQILKNLPDNSIDAVITDPPYGLSFMNKKWDYEVPSVELWKEVLRVLKPGGHLLSFGGTRTYHRLVVNIEDAGFEIRDQIQWIYGSGFPKSHNIGKAIDAISKTGKSNPKSLREVRMGDEYEPTGQVDYKKGRMFSSEITNDFTDQTIHNDYKGWGTALKPANEPICLARKPLSEKSVAENVIKWRTGGINIDKSRIGSEIIKQIQYDRTPEHGGKYGNHSERSSNGVITQTEGRFPANIILDEVAGELLDEQSGISKPSKGRTGIKGGSPIHQSKLSVDVEGKWPADNGGGASRFFYQAKVSKAERNMGLDEFDDKENNSIGSTYAGNQTTSKIGGNPDKPTEPKKNNHPTVKPINLMTYLCNLITPEGGTILDPFMGSGSTGIAALLQRYNFLGIDMDPEYTKIAEGRISNYEKYRDLLKK